MSERERQDWRQQLFSGDQPSPLVFCADRTGVLVSAPTALEAACRAAEVNREMK
jgi:hypothetical protein